MRSIVFRGVGGDDQVVQTDGTESFEKLVTRVGRSKGYVLVGNDGESVPLKKTPMELGITGDAAFDLARVVKVFDPINKQPYRLRYGGEKSEIAPTVGLDSYLSRAAGNKRVFLCKKYQNRQCRAQSKCNSIHADRKRVAELREQNPASEEAMKSERHIDVFAEQDNERFSVPLDRVFETEGSRVLAKSLSLDDSQGSMSSAGMSGCGLLCPLHDQKVPNCPAGSQCENIHIDPAYLRHTKSMWKMPCCSQADCAGNHNTNTKKALPFPRLANGREWEAFYVAEGGAASVQHPRAALTPTKGLKELCDAERGDVLAIPPTNVCRPHLRKACKWGVDCNNVHICRVRMQAASQARAQTAPAATLTRSPERADRISPRAFIVQPLQAPLDAAADDSNPPPLLASDVDATPCCSLIANSPANSPVPNLSPLLKKFQSCYASFGSAPAKDHKASFSFLSVIC